MRRGPVAWTLLFLLSPMELTAQDLPRLPCDDAPPWPTYSEAGAPLPNLQVVDVSDVNWIPPNCTGWKTPGFSMLLALAAGFRFEGNGDELLARFGAISTSKGIRYWSVSKKSWQTLITDASALDGPDINRRRPNFSTSELAEGKVLYFLQKDIRMSEPVIYGLQVLKKEQSRLIIAVENYTPVRSWLVTLFPPHQLQFLHVLDARGVGSWGLFSLLRVGPDASHLSAGHDASYVSRAVAFYRHFAAIPTDTAPPVIWPSPEGEINRIEATGNPQQ
jgi:hypothetical protein